MHYAGDMPTPKPALSLPQLITLTDAAQSLFTMLYDLERAHKQWLTERSKTAIVRLRAELARVDVLGPSVNRSTVVAEEYQPGNGPSLDEEWS